MVRVLLLVDDYRELVFLQTLLKKTGFDVDGTQNGNKFEEFRLTLNPELIIASSKGKTINGLKLAEGLKRHNDLPHFMLIVPHKMARQVQGLKLKNIDAIIDSPIDAKKLLVTMARVCHLDSDSLVEKYNKIISSLDTDNEEDLHLLKMDLGDQPSKNSVKISGSSELEKQQNISGHHSALDATSFELSLNASALSEVERKERMQRAIDELPSPTSDGFSKDVVHEWNKRIRSEEKRKDLESLEDERQRFVKQLFKKPSS